MAILCPGWNCVIRMILRHFGRWQYPYHELNNHMEAVSIKRCRLTGIVIPILKISRPHDRLILNKGIPIPGKDGLYIESGPRYERVDFRTTQTIWCPIYWHGLTLIQSHPWWCENFAEYNVLNESILVNRPLVWEAEFWHYTDLVLFIHWGRDKMDATSQMTLSNAFSWMKMLQFRLKIHWSLFPRVQLTIFQHWFR